MMARPKIAVGIDFSEYSDAALEQASWLAGKTGAELVLVHVGAETLPATGSLLPSVRVWEKIIEQRGAEEGLKAKNLAKKITSQGTPATHYILDGDPAEEIAALANREGAELVVVGTHGLTGAQYFLLGSTAEGVVRHTDCNVLVARASDRWSAGPMRILVATDFSDYAEEALRTAVALAPDDASIELLHCWQVPLPVPTPVPHGAGVATLATLATDLEAYAVQRGQELVKKYATSKLHLTFTALAGSAASTVLGHATQEAGKYDLIVTGSHGRRGVRRFFLGSVAEKIVRHSPCSVLVVHRKDEQEKAS